MMDYQLRECSRADRFQQEPFLIFRQNIRPPTNVSRRSTERQQGLRNRGTDRLPV